MHEQQGRTGSVFTGKGWERHRDRRKTRALQLSVEQMRFARSPEIAVFSAAVFYPVAKWSRDLSG